MVRELCKETETRDIERSARAAYQALAKDYYTELHPTSKAFSWTLDHSLPSFDLALEQGAWYLEIGAGKGRIQKMKGAEAARLVLLDIAESMLSQQPIHESDANAYRVQGSAFALPFPAATVAGVFSFLGDSFNHVAYYKEVERILKRHGRLLHVIPHCEWGEELRRLLRTPPDVALFLTEGAPIVAPSLLKPQDTIQRELRALDFTRISFRELRLPTNYPGDAIPEQIALPSRSLDISPYELKILLAVEAQKA